jgi:hypothetical protein
VPLGSMRTTLVHAWRQSQDSVSVAWGMWHSGKAEDGSFAIPGGSQVFSFFNTG